MWTKAGKKRALLAGFLLLANLNLHAAEDGRSEPDVLEHPYGLALYQYFQQRPLAAITEIDVGKFRNTLAQQLTDAELLLGGLYFSYGLIDDSETIFSDLLESTEDPAVSDRVWYNMARVNYQVGRYTQATELLGRISAPLPPKREQSRHYLLSRLYLIDQQLDLSQQAVDKIDRDSIWNLYARYNLALARLNNGQADLARREFTALQKQFADDSEILGLLDSSQLALGISALKNQQFEQALADFSNVRLLGPFSNRALLGAGWAWHGQNQPDQAIGYWQALVDRGQSDSATQEAWLAMPLAWEDKNQPQVAINLYQTAALRYDELITYLDLVVEQINQGELILALTQHQLVEDQAMTTLQNSTLQQGSAEYLYPLLAESKFLLELRRYQELLEIRDTLQKWQDRIPLYELMLSERRASFEQKRPLVEQSTSYAELEQYNAQRVEMASEVERIERDQDYLALANEDEADYLEQFDELESLFEVLQDTQDLTDAQVQYKLLRGLLHYQIETEFPQRHWRLKRELLQLDKALAEAAELSTSLRQAAAINDRKLVDLDQRIQGQQGEIDQQIQAAQLLLEKQRDNINRQAIASIRAQQEQLRQLRLNARYSLARLYDALASAPAPAPVTNPDPAPATSEMEQ